MLITILLLYFRKILTPLNYFVAIVFFNIDVNKGYYKLLDNFRNLQKNNVLLKLKNEFGKSVDYAIFIYFVFFLIQFTIFYFSSVAIFLIMIPYNIVLYIIKILLLIITKIEVKKSNSLIFSLHGVGRFFGAIRQWNSCIALCIWFIINLIEVYLIKLPLLFVLLLFSIYWIAFEMEYFMEEFLIFFGSTTALGAVFFGIFLMTLFFSLLEFLFIYKIVYIKGILNNIRNVSNERNYNNESLFNVQIKKKKEKKKEKEKLYV